MAEISGERSVEELLEDQSVLYHSVEAADLLHRLRASVGELAEAQGSLQFLQSRTVQLDEIRDLESLEELEGVLVEESFTRDDVSRLEGRVASLHAQLLEALDS